MAFTNTQTKLGKALVTNAAGEYALRTISGDSAQIYTVDADGAGQYATIQAALDAIDAAVVIAALTDYTTSRYLLKIAPGNYTEDITIGNAKYLKIEMAGVKVTGTCTITTTQQTGDYYSKLEFVGGAGNRPDKGDCGQITSHVTGTRNNDSLMYVGFHGMELGGNLGFTNNGTWVINTSNTMFSSSSAFVYGSFVGAGSPSVLLETGQGTRIKGHITNTDSSTTDVALYDCLDTEFDLIDITPSFGGKVRNCEFSSNVTISAGTYEVDEFSYAQMMAQTEDFTGATITRIENSVDKDLQGNYLLDDQTTTNMMSKGTVYRFDGVDDKIVVTDAAEIQHLFDSGGFLLVEVNPVSDGQSSQGRILDKSTGWRLHYISEAAGLIKLRFAQDFSGTAGQWTTDSAVCPINTDSNIEVSYDNSSVANVPIIYLNGIALAISADTTPVGTRTTDVGSDLIIGNRADAARTNDGIIGKVMLGNFAPTAAEVKDLISGNIPFKWQYGSQTANAEDDCADDDTGDWTANDSTLAFDTDHYEVVYVNVTQNVYKASTALEVGQEYELSVDIKDGTLSGVTVKSIMETAFGATTEDDPTGLMTTAAWQTHSRTFIPALPDIDVIRLNFDMTGAGNVEIKNIFIKPLGAVALYTPDSITANNWFDLANGNTGAVTGAEVLNPKGISTDEDNIPNFSVTSGITADTGSAQGNGVLTASINQISVCGNAGDAVTLPAAKPGKVLWVFNDGANASDVFPASGDNIDEAGANAALSVAANAEVQFVCTSAGHWSTITSA